MLVTIDTETTGLQPLFCSPIELCITPLTPKFDRDKGKPIFKAKLKPWAGARIEQKALEKNRYWLGDTATSLAALEKNGLGGEEFMLAYSEWMQKCGYQINHQLHPLGQNISFDLAMMDVWQYHMGIPYLISWGRQVRDTKIVMQFLHDLQSNMNGRTSLGEICKFLGIPYDPSEAHGAEKDCEYTAQAYGQFLKMFNG